MRTSILPMLSASLLKSERKDSNFFLSEKPIGFTEFISPYKSLSHCALPFNSSGSSVSNSNFLFRPSMFIISSFLKFCNGFLFVFTDFLSEKNIPQKPVRYFFQQSIKFFPIQTRKQSLPPAYFPHRTGRRGFQARF